MSVPKLRFKEFNTDWSNTSFQSLFTFKNGINASKEQYGSGTKFINVLDIINNSNGIKFDSIIGSVQVPQKDIEKNLVKYGDVLFQRSSETREEVGQSNVYLSHEPVVFGGFVIRGSAQVEYDPKFMNAVLKTEKLRDQITQLSGGSTRFNIGQDSLNKVSVDLPIVEEQTKIAFFLSQVDEKISQLNQKHELLTQYKQGMMQKLFSQKFRFKADDGSEFGEWEEKNIGEIGVVITGKTPSTNEADAWIGEVLFVTPTDMNGNKYQTKTARTVSNTQSKLLPKNTIMFTCIASIGKMSLSIKPCITNQQINSIVIKNDNPEFIYYQLLSMVEYIKSTQANTTLPIINKTEFSKFLLKITQYEEQTKVANFLSAIDQKIEVVAQQIEQAKMWKKGLLQQMFV